jgi:hypothetical protein
MTPTLHENILHGLKDDTFIDTLKTIFLVNQPKLDINLMQWPEYEKMGIRLIEIKNHSSDLRKFSPFNNKEWIIQSDLFDGISDNHLYEKNGKWDMTSDGDFLCYRWSRNFFIIYKIEKIHEVEMDWMMRISISSEDDLDVRNKMKPILTELLIQKMTPIQMLYTGEFETKFGLHFKLIQIGEHQRIRYKPTFNNVEWIKNGTLGWGGKTHGWGITSDLKIACCRVEYDEYHNFVIEVLNNEQIEYYTKIKAAL